MRFLIDECIGPSVARWLHEKGHDVVSVYLENKGAGDEWIIKKAYSDNRIIITNDKDFGEIIFRQKMPHCGVILLREGYVGASKKIAMLESVLSFPEDKIKGKFVVITKTAIRITSTSIKKKKTI